MKKIGEIPFISKNQMKKLDDLMVKDFGILVMQMMEIAGLEISLLAKNIVRKKTGKIVVLCGKGNNGGDGITAARHLENFGANATIVFPFNPAKLSGVPKHQYLISKKMKTKTIQFKKQGQINSLLKKSDLIIDSLIGYNLNGNPKSLFAELINDANSSKTRILSVDVPSGLDATTGKKFYPCIKAHATISLSLPKIGLKKNKKIAGRIYSAYMTVPSNVHQKIGAGKKNFYLDRFLKRVL